MAAQGANAKAVPAGAAIPASQAVISRLVKGDVSTDQIHSDDAAVCVQPSAGLYQALAIEPPAPIGTRFFGQPLTEDGFDLVEAEDEPLPAEIRACEVIAKRLVVQLLVPGC